MTSKEAISILECMAIDIVGALMNSNMTNSKQAALMQKIDAINLAQKALRDTSASQLDKKTTMKIENTEINNTSAFERVLCPLTQTDCKTNCGWFCEFSGCCAITTLSEILADSKISTTSWR